MSIVSITISFLTSRSLVDIDRFQYKKPPSKGTKALASRCHPDCHDKNVASLSGTPRSISGDTPGCDNGAPSVKAYSPSGFRFAAPESIPPLRRRRASTLPRLSVASPLSVLVSLAAFAIFRLYIGIITFVWRLSISADYMLPKSVMGTPGATELMSNTLSAMDGFSSMFEYCMV